MKNLLKFKKFYTNRNFNFIGLFSQDSKDTDFKLRFNTMMPRKNPMLAQASATNKNSIRKRKASYDVRGNKSATMGALPAN